MGSFGFRKEPPAGFCNLGAPEKPGFRGFPAGFPSKANHKGTFEEGHTSWVTASPRKGSKPGAPVAGRSNGFLIYPVGPPYDGQWDPPTSRSSIGVFAFDMFRNMCALTNMQFDSLQ